MRLIGTTDSSWGKPLSTLANLGIDYLVPRTPPIAAASCAVGWYSYRYLMTYSQQILADTVTQQFQKFLGETVGGYTGHLFAPLVVPEASPYFAAEISVGLSLATSLALNIVANLCFGIKKQSGGEAFLKRIAQKSTLEKSKAFEGQKTLIATKEKPLEVKVDKPSLATQSVVHKTFTKSFLTLFLNPCDCCCTEDLWKPK